MSVPLDDQPTGGSWFVDPVRPSGDPKEWARILHSSSEYLRANSNLSGPGGFEAAELRSIVPACSGDYRAAVPLMTACAEAVVRRAPDWRCPRCNIICMGGSDPRRPLHPATARPLAVSWHRINCAWRRDAAEHVPPERPLWVEDTITWALDIAGRHRPLPSDELISAEWRRLNPGPPTRDRPPPDLIGPAARRLGALDPEYADVAEGIAILWDHMLLDDSTLYFAMRYRGCGYDGYLPFGVHVRRTSRAVLAHVDDALEKPLSQHVQAP